MEAHVDPQIPGAPPGKFMLGRAAQALDSALRKRIVLVTAPAGYGKTALVAHAARNVANRPDWHVIWLDLSKVPLEVARSHSLLPSLQDAAICSADAAIAQAVEAEGSAIPESASVIPSSLSGEEDLYRFAQRLSGVPGRILMIIDAIDLLQDDALVSVNRLIRIMPDNVCLVLAGRANRGIQLFDARLKGQVVEIGQHDLALTHDELVAHLAKEHVATSSDEVDRLFELTQGWPLGLRCALSAFGRARNDRHSEQEGRSDAQGALESWVQELLSQEVLPRYSEDERTVMLRSTLLDVMDASVIAALSGWPFARAENLLRSMEEQGLVVRTGDIAPDRSYRAVMLGSWYRFHPMFKDQLRALAASTVAGDDLTVMVGEAVGKYESYGQLEQALQLCLRVEDYDTAFRITPHNVHEVLSNASSSFMAQIVEGAPPQDDKQRYFFSLIKAWGAFISGKTKQAKRWLEEAEAARDESQAIAIRGAESVYGTVKVGVMVFSGEYEEALALAASYLDNLGGPRLFLRCTIMHNIGEAFMRLGRYDDAYESFARARVNAEISGRRVVYLLCSYEMARLDYIRGNLDGASNMVLRTLATCSSEEKKSSWAAGLLKAMLARIYTRWGRVDTAKRYLREALQCLSPAVNRDAYLEARIAQAELFLLEGNVNEAYRTMLEVHEVLRLDKVPRGIDLLGLLTFSEVLVAMRDGGRARSLLDEVRASANPSDTYMQLKATALMGFLLLREGRPEEARPIFEEVVSGASTSRLEALTASGLVGLACALNDLGDKRSAQEELLQALQIAARTDNAYPIAIRLEDCGSQLYHIAHKTAMSAAMVDRYEEAIAFAALIIERFGTSSGANGRPTSSTYDREQELQRLSRREREVYRLLVQGATRGQVAEELGITLNTVRTHVKSIYKKLDIHDRSEL